MLTCFGEEMIWSIIKKIFRKDTKIQHNTEYRHECAPLGFIDFLFSATETFLVPQLPKGIKKSKVSIQVLPPPHFHFINLLVYIPLKLMLTDEWQ